MSKMFAAIIAFGAVVAVGGSMYWWHYTGTEASLRRGCISTISSRLKAPATLNVTYWGQMKRRPAELDEVVGERPTRAKYGSQFELLIDLHEQKLELFNLRPGHMLEIPFEYEAANSFGTPIRSAAICTYHTSYEAGREKIREESVMIDGKSKLAWSIGQLSGMR